jgi:hypothetical protein
VIGTRGNAASGHKRILVCEDDGAAAREDGRATAEFERQIRAARLRHTSMAIDFVSALRQRRMALDGSMLTLSRRTYLHVTVAEPTMGELGAGIKMSGERKSLEYQKAIGRRSAPVVDA